MDTHSLDKALLECGHKYVDALEHLGMKPECAFWAYDEELEQFFLVLITSMFDYAGPLKLAEKLFKAYNSHGLPAEIDPFQVRLHSPKQTIYRNIAPLLTQRITGADFALENPHVNIPESLLSQPIAIRSDGLYVHPDWIYRFAPVKRNEVGRQWNKFVTRVDSLAA
ncbi:hypothetical protein BJF92_12300 [Rhizobium rhizosphaerae]|uniref:Uncharacterized protein n=1 Tax=Xaviernesmea rhizosphaerae TaxID=1672749 RepID=A0A1Q9ANE6_9HYPH|nr:hypothetical protein [Xaviernesmea rhizosphaerae]OLP56845.1 hypothetical protein BJF92_12300 [Xaviernesmea rhizosphaerae]